jgi:cytochrome P450
MTSTTERAPILPDFEPLSPEFQANPYPTLERARNEEPVFYYPALDFWVLTRYEDVDAVIGDYKGFSSRAFGVVPVPEEYEDRVPGDFFSKTLLASDPPEHTVLRKKAQKALTRGRIAAMEPTIREICNELIDEFVDDGECDLMKQYANEVTLRTIVRMVDLPEEDIPRLRGWARDVVAVISPRSLTVEGVDAPVKPMSEEERLERYGHLAEARDYFRALIDERRENPGKDVISALVAADTERETPALDRERIVSHLSELLTAGTTTTANLLGQMVRLFDAAPEQRRRVQESPELMENAVEEALRHSGSTLGVFRVATRDATFGDVTVPAGSLVWACYASTGRDDERFENAATFDISRSDAAEHLEFGKGRHFCLGAPLGRLESRAAMQELYARIPGIQVVADQELEYVPSIVTTSLQGLRVQWDAEGVAR